MTTLNDLPMGGCSRAEAHHAHLAAGESRCENERGRFATRKRTLFTADCGHSWVADEWGSYECPDCGRYEGDHHLTSMAPVTVVVTEAEAGAGDE